MAGKVVAMPWPISACDRMMVTRSSDAIRTQALSALAVALCALARPTAPDIPITSALPAARKDRRSISAALVNWNSLAPPERRQRLRKLSLLLATLYNRVAYRRH